MAKQALFLVISNGEDGRGKERIEFASINEKERDQWHKGHRNKNYYTTVDRVIDLEAEKKQTLRQLNALQKLSLGLALPECKKPL